MYIIHVYRSFLYVYLIQIYRYFLCKESISSNDPPLLVRIKRKTISFKDPEVLKGLYIFSLPFPKRIMAFFSPNNKKYSFTCTSYEFSQHDPLNNSILLDACKLFQISIIQKFLFPNKREKK